jgi:hypothetical protein
MDALLAGGYRGSEDNARYPGQKIMVVMIEGYAHAVPYRMEGEIGIMITVYPSRAMQKRFGGIQP